MKKNEEKREEILLIKDSESNNSEVMSNKQIEEMAKIICPNIYGHYGCDSCDLYDNNCCLPFNIAKSLTDKGYRKQSEWISVDEKFPKHLEKVLVCDDKQNMFMALYVTYDNGGFDWCTSVRLVYKVTHWMPLPEAPKMKGGEG